MVDTYVDPDERVDRRILQGVVDGWILDPDTVRSWTRNPMIYVAAVSDSAHDLVTVESAAPEVRMRHILTKLHAVPKLLAAARTNVHAPPNLPADRRHQVAQRRLERAEGGGAVVE